jgi:3-methylfumaryl-CoA hydratase
MTQTEDARLREWIGKKETATDRLDADRARALEAALDRTGPALRSGDYLPPLRHWLYFWTIVPRSGLGRDGHPALGGFLPPVGTARRMWAGSRVRFPGRLRLGEEVERTSTILDVVVKSGRSGRLVFVTVRHEITGARGLAVVDEHDIVYREDRGAGASGRGGEPAPTDAPYSERVTADSTLLFRYSALTFNGHRIHYDREYAINVEGYRGLVVHGPLLATLMLDLAARSAPERPVASFEFRGHRPISDAEPFTVCAAPRDDGGRDLWIADHEGLLAMKGDARFL